MNNNVVAVIQARMKSNRLPDKAMLPLAGKPLLEHVITRAKAIYNVNHVIIATSYGSVNNPIADLGYSLGCRVFRGSDENVLERYFIVSNLFECDYIVRITADNPIIDVDAASYAVEQELKNDYDLLALVGLPIGTGVEIFTKEAIHTTSHEAKSYFDKEHVTTYIKNNPDKFNVKIEEIQIENPFDFLRLTVDFQEDYDLVKIIYDNLYSKNNLFSSKDVIDFLKEDPKLVEINKNRY